MNTLNLIKKWLAGGCVYYTLVSLIMIALNFLVSGPNDSGVIHTPSFLLFLPFGLCMSAAGMLFSCKKISPIVQYLLHFVITVLSVFLFLWLPSNAAASASTGLILLMLFSVLYWIFLGLVVWIRSRVRKLMEED